MAAPGEGRIERRRAAIRAPAIGRREFITIFGATFTAWPLGAFAQQTRAPIIGVLVHEAPGWPQFWQLFPEALRELGYVEGKNIRFEFRSDQEDLSRLPELAAELVRLKVDVIVPWFTPAAIAARQATRNIPIVMALVGNPVESGLVESLARPGGNVTGMAGVGAELSGKSVELLRDLMPAARRVAALANAPDPFSKSFLKYIQLAGDATGTSIDQIMIHSPEELDAAFTAMERSRPDAMIVQPSLPAKRGAELALSYRIPATSIIRAFAFDGGLMSYFASEIDMYRRAAIIVDKILKGAKPADIPVEQPTKFNLVVNLTTAKALGLMIPESFLLRADEVIE